MVIIAIIIGISAVVKYSGTNSKDINTNPIKIGAILSLTGDAAPWGEYGKNGMMLAVKEINKAGGIGGRPIEMTIEDDHTDPKQGVSAWNKLVAVDHVQGVVGGVFDFTAQPLIPLALNSKIPFISPSNFRISGGFDLNSQSFVMLTDFDKTIMKLKPYIASSTIKKLAVVHFKSTFGNEIAETLGDVMTSLGRSGIINEPYGQIGNNDFKTTIIKLKNQHVDGVFLDMVANDPLIFLKQAKQLGFNPVIMTYNGALDAFANEADKSPLNGAVILNWEVTTKAFNDSYKNEYGILPTKSADKYYEAVYVVAEALAKSPSPAEAASYMASHSFETPNGAISFTPDHAVSDSPVEIQKIEFWAF